MLTWLFEEVRPECRDVVGVIKRNIRHRVRHRHAVLMKIRIDVYRDERTNQLLLIVYNPRHIAHHTGSDCVILLSQPSLLGQECSRDTLDGKVCSLRQSVFISTGPKCLNRERSANVVRYCSSKRTLNLEWG
jgi:hypothetical protein